MKQPEPVQLSSIDDAFAGMQEAVTHCMTTCHSMADDPAATEGQLRQALRDVAPLLGRLLDGNGTLWQLHQRNTRRLGILALAFLVLLVLNVAGMVLR